MFVQRRGKRYDTKAADKIGSFDNNLSENDSKYYKETLYRKKTGEFFLHREGGAESPAAMAKKLFLEAGQELIILTPTEAEQWGKLHLPHDTLEYIFSDKINEKYKDINESFKAYITISLLDENIEFLKKEKKSNHIPYKDTVRFLLDSYYETLKESGMDEKDFLKKHCVDTSLKSHKSSITLSLFLSDICKLRDYCKHYPFSYADFFDMIITIYNEKHHKII